MYKNPKVKWYRNYTIVYFILIFAVFGWFVINGKSFIWKSDGFSQHYNILMYYGEYLRKCFRGLLEGSFHFPQYDFSIGYGADILTSFNYYSIGDPLTLLSIFVPKQGTEYLYDLLILVRIYLAGIAFLYFCQIQKKEGYASLVGAIIYSFCGFTLYAAVRHPYFINPMIYLPLLLVGAEKIYRKQRPYLFIGMIMIAAISNFYFFYMLCILLFLYAVFRFFYYVKEDYIKNLIHLFGRFLGYFIVGLLLSAIVFLPVVYGFLHCGRGADEADLILHYPWKFYKQFFSGFITSVTLGSWTHLGYGILPVYAVLLLFTEKKKRGLQIGFLLLSAMLLIPACGKLMNGMAYVSNRWCFGYAMLVAYITVDAMPRVLQMTKREKKIAAVLTLLLAIYQCYAYGVVSATTLLIGGMLLAFLAILFFVKKEKQRKIAFLLLCILNIAANARVRYMEGSKPYISQFVDSGKGYSLLTNTFAGAVKHLDDTSFYRVDLNTSSSGAGLNNELQAGFSRTGYFYSIANEKVIAYLKENGHNNSCAHLSSSLNERTMLEALASTKYFVTKNSSAVPYGYHKVKGLKKKDTFGYHIYENEFALPMGYTYDSYITREQYDAYPMEGKQQALLQSALLEEPAEKVAAGNPIFTQEELSYTTNYDRKKLIVKENKIKVLKPDTTLTLQVPRKENSETYLKIKNLQFKNKDTAEDNKISISFKAGNTKSSITYRQKNNQFYFGAKDYLLNLNYSKKGIQKIQITFHEKGTYTFDALKVICQPMEQYEEKISKLKEEVMENVTVGNDCVTGTVSVAKEKILCLSIPYSKGWTAYVDGKVAELKQANTMYLALELSKGTHEIRLVYRTPLLRTGMFLTGIGVIAVIGIVLVRRRKIKRSSN